MRAIKIVIISIASFCLVSISSGVEREASAVISRAERCPYPALTWDCAYKAAFWAGVGVSSFLAISFFLATPVGMQIQESLRRSPYLAIVYATMLFDAAMILRALAHTLKEQEQHSVSGV
jgi:hypothetical protein